MDTGLILLLIFLATLLGAIGTYLLRKYKVLPYLPPIVSNTLIIPPILLFAYGFGGDMPTWLFYLVFFAGEALSVLVFGFILRKALENTGVFAKLHRNVPQKPKTVPEKAPVE